MRLDYSPIEQKLNKYCYPQDSLLSVYLLGTSAEQKIISDVSDIDILFIIKDTIENDFLINIGKDFRKALKDIFKNKKIFIFDSPSYDRPDIFKEYPIRIHLLVHKEEWVQRSLNDSNWVFVCWSNKNKLLVGQKVLKNKKGILNSSIIDEFDGLPNVIKRIDFSILAYDIKKYQIYFKKIYKYSLSRYNNIVKTFPELNFEIISNVDGKPIYMNDILFMRNVLVQLNSKIKIHINKLDCESGAMMCDSY